MFDRRTHSWVTFSLHARAQYEQTIADMLQKQSLRLDANQENECQQLEDRLKYELDILMAYQNKNRMQAQAQRDRERKELEDRVSVRRSLLESKVSCALRIVGLSAFLLIWAYDLARFLSINLAIGIDRITFLWCIRLLDGRRTAAIQHGTWRTNKTTK